MSGKDDKVRILNIRDLLSALMALQVAIAKVANELIKKEQREEKVYIPDGPDPVYEECGPPSAVDEECGPPSAVDEECGPPSAVDEECGPTSAVDEECGPTSAVDEECGPTSAVNEECGPGYLDERCVTPPPVPEICDEQTIEKLCDRLEEITRYLRIICKVVRR